MESLKAIGVKNINHKLDDSKVVLDGQHKAGFGSDFWHYCVKAKIKHLVNTLKDTKSVSPKYYIFTDCDVRMIQKNVTEWDSLQKYIDKEKPDKDVFFMIEGTSRDVNTGFFIIKNNTNLPQTISFFEQVLEIMEKSKIGEMPFGDQSIVNNIKDQLNFDFIPSEYVIFGNTIFNKNKCLVHHAIGTIGTNDKVLAMNDMKINIE